MSAGIECYYALVNVIIMQLREPLNVTCMLMQLHASYH